MKKILLGTGLALTMFACTTTTTDSEHNTDNKVKEESKEKTVEAITKDVVDIEEEIIAVELKEFSGNFFAVKYPDNFTVTPTKPTFTHEGIESVDTDEAYFYAPDSSVVFFVYSPQWSGNPENYLNKRENEENVSQDKNESKEDDFITTTESGSFKDKTGKYNRAYVSITSGYEGDSETKKVFGIQYVDQESYDKYRETYKAFKKSLKQFAD